MTSRPVSPPRGTHPPRAISMLCIGLLAIVLGATLAAPASVAVQRAQRPLTEATTSHHVVKPTASRSPARRVDAAIRRVRAAVKAAKLHKPIPRPLHPSLRNLAADAPDVGGCDYSVVEHKLCRRGFVHGHHVLVAFGDSHMLRWIPALQVIAKKNRYAAYYLAKPGCNAADVTPSVGDGKPFRACLRWRRWAISQVRQLNPDLLIVASALPGDLLNGRGKVVSDPAAVARLIRPGLVRSIDAMRDHVGSVDVMSDPPGLQQPPRTCLRAPDADLGDCTVSPPDSAGLLYDAQRAAATRTSAQWIDVGPWFCAQGLCPTVVDSTITYHDVGHITTVYARSLSDVLEASLAL